MPGDVERRRKAAERKAAKRKEKKRAIARATAVQAPTSPRGRARAAARWPYYEAQISRGWNDTNKPPGITQVIVARQSPRGEVGAGFFLVDLGCLGVKNAFTHVFESPSEYRERLGPLAEAGGPLIAADLDLAAKVVGAGIDYARELGFAPHRDYADAARYLEGAHPELCAVEVPLGYQGKPYYASGPFDNPRKVLAQLTRAVGPGNFEFTAAIAPPGALVEEGELVAEEDEEDEEE